METDSLLDSLGVDAMSGWHGGVACGKDIDQQLSRVATPPPKLCYEGGVATTKKRISVLFRTE